MFKDGTMVPQKITNKGANCSGENISPQLSWSNVPAGTKSLAIMLVDPKAPAALGVISLGGIRHRSRRNRT